VWPSESTRRYSSAATERIVRTQSRRKSPPIPSIADATTLAPPLNEPLDLLLLVVVVSLLPDTVLSLTLDSGLAASCCCLLLFYHYLNKKYLIIICLLPSKLV
jgi:hypothetical protein